MKKNRALAVLILAFALSLGPARAQAQAQVSSIYDFTGHNYYSLNQGERLSLVFGMVAMSALVSEATEDIGTPEVQQFYADYFNHYLTVSQVMDGIDVFYRQKPLSTALVWAYMNAAKGQRSGR